MILKSMSRKSPSFRQLGNYIRRGSDPKYRWITHNLLSPDGDLNGIIQEFEENTSRMKKRKNGNYLYHQVISVSPEEKTVTPEILEDLAREHIERYAKGALAVAKLHWERNKPPHVHIMMSSCDITGKKLRMPIGDFVLHQRNLEKYQREQWPQLEHSIVFSPEQDRKREQEREGKNLRNDYRREEAKRQSREIQTERRFEVAEKDTGKPKPLKKKELLKKQIEACLRGKDCESFEKLLARCEPPLTLYKRGQQWGVKREEQSKQNPEVKREIKYRLKTLEIDFELRLREWELAKTKEVEIKRTRETPKLTQNEQEIEKEPEVLSKALPTLDEPNLDRDETLGQETKPELSREEKRDRELREVIKARKREERLERQRGKRRGSDLER